MTAVMVTDGARAWQGSSTCHARIGHVGLASDAMTLTVLDHPLAHDLLSRLRDEETGSGSVPIAHPPPGLAARPRGHEGPRDRRRDHRDTRWSRPRAELAGRAARRGAGPASGPRAPGRRHRSVPRHRRRLPRDGARRGHAGTSRLLREAPHHGGPSRPGARSDARHRVAPARRRSRTSRATRTRSRSRSSASSPPRRASRGWRPNIPTSRSSRRRWTASSTTSGSSCPASATSATACTARSDRLERIRAPDRIRPQMELPPSYARPAAAGGRTFPTNPASDHDRDDVRRHADELGRQEVDQRRIVEPSAGSPGRTRTGTRRRTSVGSGSSSTGSTRRAR